MWDIYIRVYVLRTRRGEHNWYLNLLGFKMSQCFLHRVGTVLAGMEAVVSLCLRKKCDCRGVVVAVTHFLNTVTPTRMCYGAGS